MKIGIVTWTTYNNYGTVLQAYALQRKVRSLGFEGILLYDEQILKSFFDNKRENISAENDKENGIPEKAARDNAFNRRIKLFKNPKRLIRRLTLRFNGEKYERPLEEIQRACNCFKSDEMNISRAVLPDQTAALNEEYDAFIAGSDQIWSASEDIFNPYYYLSFGKTKKISYAPSLGIERVSANIEPQIKALLSDYSAISVREKASADYLTGLLERKVEWVADPTLLYDGNEWADFAKNIKISSRPYLLCYFLEDREWYFELAEKLAKEMSLRIILIPNKWDFLKYEYIAKFSVGPKEFIALHQNADYVLTDSYHSSIFSILFNKEFRYLLRFSNDDPASQNMRIKSLFGYLGIEGRIVEKGNCEVKCELDYEVINERLRIFREHSLGYLKESLNRLVSS